MLGDTQSTATLSHSLSKSDIHYMKIRVNAQWRVNRQRMIHALRHEFEHECITEMHGTATLAPVDMYDRFQSHSGTYLKLTKKEVPACPTLQPMHAQCQTADHMAPGHVGCPMADASFLVATVRPALWPTGLHVLLDAPHSLPAEQP